LLALEQFPDGVVQLHYEVAARKSEANHGPLTPTGAGFE